MKRAIILFIATLTLFSCGKRLLQDYTDCPEQPLLFPDYTDITVPCNIAPLNFQLEGALLSRERKNINSTASPTGSSSP